MAAVLGILAALVYLPFWAFIVLFVLLALVLSSWQGIMEWSEKDAARKAERNALRRQK